jgi:hypothetical protein
MLMTLVQDKSTKHHGHATAFLTMPHDNATAFLTMNTSLFQAVLGAIDVTSCQTMPWVLVLGEFAACCPVLAQQLQIWDGTSVNLVRGRIVRVALFPQNRQAPCAYTANLLWVRCACLHVIPEHHSIGEVFCSHID